MKGKPIDYGVRKGDDERLQEEREMAKDTEREREDMWTLEGH